MGVKKPLIVIIAVDSHLKRVEAYIENIKSVYKDSVDIAFSNYGVICPHRHDVRGHYKQEVKEFNSEIKKYCAENNYEFFEYQKQEFVPDDREFYVCEIIAFLSISRYFYEKGYSHVFISHSDIEFQKDCLGDFYNSMQGDWSFVCAYANESNGRKIDLEEAKTLTGFEMDKVSIRAGSWFICFNPVFVEFMFDIYSTEEEMWDRFFHSLFLHSDCSLFDMLLFRNFEGKIIEKSFLHGASCSYRDLVI